MFDQLAPWAVLVAVLLLIATGRFRNDLVALAGLLVLGATGLAPTEVLFRGFGHPALITIVAVFFISEGLIVSGLMRGLGQALARKVRTVDGQILSLSLATALLSAFMNNVGAVGLTLPTAVRMAARSKSDVGRYGLPLAMATMLGGTLTLIGSAPNIIVAAHMLTSSGKSFSMFDFAPHGLAMLGAALLVWYFLRPRIPEVSNEASQKIAETEVLYFTPFSSRIKQVTLLIIVVAIALVSIGLLHPAMGFGGAALLLVIFGVLKMPEAYQCIELHIVVFLGSMLGIGQVLEHTGALQLLSDLLAPLLAEMSPFGLILTLVFVASALSTAINNAAAAVFMAPLAVSVAEVSGLQLTAALMAVAAGTNMSLLLPTHQATQLVLSKAPFSTKTFVRAGVILTLFCGVAAALMIALVWQGT